MILGIDPGKEGAYALLNNGEMYTDNLPYNGVEIDIRELDSQLQLRADQLHVVLEKCSNYKMNGKSAQSFFTNYGQIIAWVLLRSLPLSMVTPQNWQKKILGHTTDDKTEAIAYVKRRWPMADLPTAKKWASGQADACCIAEYGSKHA